MAVDLMLLGSKLKKFREHLQLSLAEVAAATGIIGDDLSAFEDGHKKPSGDEILVLADYYKCDFKYFISADNIAPFEQAETLFRKYGTVFSKQDRWAVQEFMFLCECEEFLMNNSPGITRKPFQFEKIGDYYKGHGEKAANKLRRHLGYSSNAVPMNVFHDFRTIGLHVFRRQLSNSNISGICIKHPDVGKCVLVNYSEDVYRQRFSAAHEAAHTILDDQDVVVSFANAGWNQADLSEIRANVFASRYLIPPEFLVLIRDSANWSPEKAVDWANKLMVSTEALAYALRDAKLISEGLELEIKSVKIPSDLKTDPELPLDLSPRSRDRRQEMLRRGLSVSYVNLCFDAYESGLVSAGRLAEMLLIDEGELIEVGNMFRRQLYYDS